LQAPLWIKLTFTVKQKPDISEASLEFTVMIWLDHSNCICIPLQYLPNSRYS